MELTSPDADARVSAWVAEQYRADGMSNAHLRTCPDLAVTYEGRDGVWGCDTGCEYWRFEATMTCPHGEREEYEYGDFGTLADILDDLLNGE